MTRPEALMPVPAPADLLAEIRALCRTVRHYQSGRINQHGKVEGVRDYPAGKHPFERQDHHLDERGRVVYLERFTRDFSKPTIRCYRYADATSAVTEAIWLDRYGQIENCHRYGYDEALGLLLWRAEYDHTGQLYYSIRSGYDARNHLVEEAWYDGRHRFMKRYDYTYDDRGELATESHFDAEARLQGFNRFRYDARGNLLERAWHNATGEVMSRFVYAVDARDMVSRLELYGQDGRLQVRQDFEYDPDGNVVRELWHDERSRLIKDLRY